MLSVDKAIIARMKSHGHSFEILVDCEKAIAVREGKQIPLSEVAAAMNVFSDAKKGLEAPKGALQEAFETTNAEEIILAIIKKGEIQLTQEYRENLRNTKRKQIVDIIHRNGVDPKTHSPHPIARIENAFQEAKIHIDEFRDVNGQVQDILKKIKPILPIRFEIKEIEVKISPEYAPKCYSSVRNFGTLLKDEWQNNGYWIAVVEIPGGMESDFYDKLNKICHGNMEARLIKTK